MRYFSAKPEAVLSFDSNNGCIGVGVAFCLTGAGYRREYVESIQLSTLIYFDFKCKGIRHFLTEAKNYKPALEQPLRTPA